MNLNVKKFFIQGLPIVLAALAFFAVSSNLYAYPGFTEKPVLLGRHKNGEKVYRKSIQISDDKQHIAYISESRDGRVRVWVDGIAGESYLGVSTPVIAPVTNRVGYIAAKNQGMFAVIDGRKGPIFKKADSLVFSPDGSRFAYRAMTMDGKVVAVIDNIPGPEFYNIKKKPGIIFSDDSAHFAYTAINMAESQVMVKDHKELTACEEIASPVFSLDSKRFAYAAKSEKGWAVICDQKKGEYYEAVFELTFSPDSRHLAYIGKRNTRFIVVKDNKEIESAKSAGMLFFSPCSNIFGYLMKKNRAWHVVVNGEKGPAIARPDKVAFSDDCSHFAYSAQIGKDWVVIKDNIVIAKNFKKIRYIDFLSDNRSVIYVAVEKTGKQCVVVDDKKGPLYDSVGIPVENPGKKGTFAYVASKKGKGMTLVIDGKEQKPYRYIGIGVKAEGKTFSFAQQPFFSPDGKHVAYPVKDEKGRSFMVVDGKSQEYYEAVSEPVFSPDGKHIAYTARKNNGWIVVVDGMEGKEKFAGVIWGADIVFDSPSSFYVLVLKFPGPSFYKLQVTIH